MATAKKKVPVKKPSRWWLVPKLLMLLGIGGLSGVLATIFVMEKELDRINFFRLDKKPVFDPAKPEPLALPVPPAPAAASRPPAATRATGPTPSTSSTSPANRPRTETPNEGEKKRRDGDTSARAPEDLSRADRKKLEDILRTR